MDVILMCFKSMKIKSVSVQTQLNSIYYIELHVSTYLRSSSGSQLVLKHAEEEIYIMEVCRTQLQLLKLLLFMTSIRFILIIITDVYGLTLCIFLP
jgi:hypothetical protein